MNTIERLAHSAFADHRVRNNREFFEIDQQRVISALQMTGGTEVTPKSDIAADEQGLIALGKTKSRRRIWSLFDAEIKVGDVLTFSRDETITATVIAKRKVEFRSEQASVSAAALAVLHELGYTWNTVNGWEYWMFDDETIAERLNRILDEKADED